MGGEAVGTTAVGAWECQHFEWWWYALWDWRMVRVSGNDAGVSCWIRLLPGSGAPARLAAASGGGSCGTGFGGGVSSSISEVLRHRPRLACISNHRKVLL